jgi:S1-C subfamily serine protease
VAGSDREPVEKVPLRRRILPRTVLGISSLILALSVGAAFSGVVLYSYYQFRLDQTNTRVNTLIQQYSTQFKNAESQLAAQANQDKSQIQTQLAPLQQLEAQSATLADLVKVTEPSLFFVHTLDEAGQASVGTAFVVASNTTQSLLLTSYTTIKAATTSPAPPVYIQQGGASALATVRTWDPQFDMALIVVPKGHLIALKVAPPSPAPTIGQRVFAMSGEGSSGASISQGAITDVSASGIEHNTAMGAAYQGGPLLNAEGQVLGVDSLTYAPLGYASTGVWFAPYVNSACAKVLSCPGGSISAST